MVFAGEARTATPGTSRASLSARHQGSDVWTAAFVLGALAMIVTRTTVVAVWTRKVAPAQPA
jgi:hypothetical protein